MIVFNFYTKKNPTKDEDDTNEKEEFVSKC